MDPADALGADDPVGARPTTNEPAAPTVRPGGRARRVGRSGRLLAGLLLVFAPVLVVSLSPWSQAASLPFMGLLPALLGGLVRPRDAWLAPIAAAGAVLVAVLLSPWPAAGAAWMALVGLGVAASAPTGRMSVAAAAAVPTALALVAPPTLENVVPGAGLALRAGATSGLVLAGGLWGAVVVTALRRHLPLPGRTPSADGTSVDVRLMAALLCPLVALATFVTMRWFPGTHAWWLTLTILVVLRPTHELTRTRALARTAGTIVGGTAAALVSIVAPWPQLLLVLGVLVGIAAAVVAVTGPYSRYAALLTVAIVLMTGEVGSALVTDLTRVVSTLVGAALVLVAVSAGREVLRRSARLSP